MSSSSAYKVSSLLKMRRGIPKLMRGVLPGFELKLFTITDSNESVESLRTEHPNFLFVRRLLTLAEFEG